MSFMSLVIFFMSLVLVHPFPHSHLPGQLKPFIVRLFRPDQSPCPGVNVSALAHAAPRSPHRGAATTNHGATHRSTFSSQCQHTSAWSPTIWGTSHTGTDRLQNLLNQVLQECQEVVLQQLMLELEVLQLQDQEDQVVEQQHQVMKLWQIQVMKREIHSLGSQLSYAIELDS